MLLVVAAVVGVGLPIYRVSSRGSISTPEAQAQTEIDLADQGSGTTTPQTNAFQIPTRLLYQTNGTASIWFQVQTNGQYRIDYADNKAATATDMVWNVAVDGLTGITNTWTEWVDAGATNRASPSEVNQRYYRVVLETTSENATNVVSGETTQSLSPLWGTSISTNTDTNTVGTTGGDSGSTASLPTEILELLQNQSSLTQLTLSGSARNLAALQECETLGELVAGGEASESALSNALVASKLRISMLMTFGQSLFRSGDRHHAEMFFDSIVTSHANKATVKQVARSYLWLGKLHQDDGLDLEYQQGEPDQAAVEFDAAATDYLSAKDASPDWVRGSAWLGAAACYREMGDQANRRQCLRGLLNDQSSSGQDTYSQVSTNGDGVDRQLKLVQRDTANYLLASSYYEQKQYQAAAQIYSQMVVRINAQLTTNSAEYHGQASYLSLANSGVAWCATQQIKQASAPLPTGNTTQPTIQVVP